jgi:hypothetical protein
MTTESSMETLNPRLARVLERPHYPLDVILTCVRWYVTRQNHRAHVAKQQLIAALMEMPPAATGITLVELAGLFRPSSR